MENTILKEADLFCPNSVRINFTIYLIPLLTKFRRILSPKNKSHQSADQWFVSKLKLIGRANQLSANDGIPLFID
ncbi:hypothetical protein LZ3411_1343 [Levilactobacillus zymae]|uniref:Aspartate aminotransferase n=1 Tax=Levilactobacillus zymae TaxID=267363 RepID=A0A1Y6JZW7_9LACO|nr:hypothetical protein LZ3411_1343 [Levilactobacillus zymae]